MSKVAIDRIFKKPMLHDHDAMIMNSFIMVDANGIKWTVTMSTSGSFVITAPASNSGQPIGLLLALTYP